MYTPKAEQVAVHYSIPNEVVLLDGQLHRIHDATASRKTFSNFFTEWLAGQILKNHGLDIAEIGSGITDGTHDCGIDAIYVLFNGILLQEDRIPDGFQKNGSLELVIVQAKSSGGFGEAALNTLIARLTGLLKFDRDESKLADSTNSRVLEITRRFLYAWNQLNAGQPSLRIVFGGAKVNQIHPNVRDVGNQLSQQLRSSLGVTDSSVEFLTGIDLWQISQQNPETTIVLPLAENAMASSISGGFVCLVDMSVFASFITLGAGEINTSLFEANVRDYETGSEVNRNIYETLDDNRADLDFWWLNNGVSIVAKKVEPVGMKQMRLTDPQIVNGLQTSTEIYKYFRAGGSSLDRTLLVKIVEAEDLDRQEAIIKATNSQTALGWGAIRATDTVQRQIEQFLFDAGLFYERRKNYYFNLGKPQDKIVPMQELAQAVASIHLQEPHTARDSVAQLFSNEYYKRIFSSDMSVHAYLACIQLDRQVADILSFLPDLRGSAVEDWRFQVSSYCAVLLTRSPFPTSRDLRRIEGEQLAAEDVKRAFADVRDAYNLVSRRKRISLMDRLARHGEVTTDVLKKATARIDDPDWTNWGPVSRHSRRTAE